MVRRIGSCARAALIATGRIDEAADTRLWEEARSAIARAVTQAEVIPPIDPLTMFDDVFAVPTTRLEEERREHAASHPSSGGPA